MGDFGKSLMKDLVVLGAMVLLVGVAVGASIVWVFA